MAKIRKARQRYPLVSSKGVNVTVAHDDDTIQRYVNRGYVDPTGKYRPEKSTKAKVVKAKAE